VTDRIDYDDAGNLDDVEIENVRMFRLELWTITESGFACIGTTNPIWLSTSKLRARLLASITKTEGDSGA